MQAYSFRINKVRRSDAHRGNFAAQRENGIDQLAFSRPPPRHESDRNVPAKRGRIGYRRNKSYAVALVPARLAEDRAGPKRKVAVGRPQPPQLRALAVSPP